MSDLIIEKHSRIYSITLNRIAKKNAFDDHILEEMHHHLTLAEADTTMRAIVLKANGPCFSAGADLAWMKRMSQYTESEQLADAKILSKLLYALYTCSKPTIASVQGSTFGGGIGLIAACDVAIASDNVEFCFSEIKLGLIPAVISPFVIQAIGPRAANALFLTGDTFNAKRAEQLQLIHKITSLEDLSAITEQYAQRLASFPPQALKESKELVQKISLQEINLSLMNEVERRIASRRSSDEARLGLNAFLNKQTLVWD